MHCTLPFPFLAHTEVVWPFNTLLRPRHHPECKAELSSKMATDIHPAHRTVDIAEGSRPSWWGCSQRLREGNHPVSSQHPYCLCLCDTKFHFLCSMNLSVDNSNLQLRSNAYIHFYRSVCVCMCACGAGDWIQDLRQVFYYWATSPEPKNKIHFSLIS